MVKDINESELREYIKNSPKPIVIDFYAPWCGPCKTSEPLVSEFAEKNSDSTDFYKINVDSNPDMTGEYEIRKIALFAENTKFSIQGLPVLYNNYIMDNETNKIQKLLNN